jgi:L-lactate dehydrogenase complex protein LldG
MNARQAILGKVRHALGRAPSDAFDSEAAVDTHMAARPIGPRPSFTSTPVERFRERALALSSTVEQVASLGEVPGAIAHYLAAGGLPKAAICWPALAQLDWTGAGLDVLPRPATGGDLVGITGAFCAIADTGTLMLLSSPDTPAATSLLPETHIAVVSVTRVVPYMEDGWRLLREEHASPPRAVNFVSGPSRTADVEQTVTLGAHGPYRVHIVLVG